MLRSAPEVNRTSVAGVALFATTFLFVFGWKVTPTFDLILLVSLATAATAFVMLGGPLSRQVNLIVWPLLLLSALALLVASIAQEPDLQFALRTLRAIINLLGAAGLALLYQRSMGTEWTTVAVRHVFWCIVLHAILVIAMYLNPGLRQSVYTLTDSARYINNSASFLMGLRIPGLTYGLSQTSVLHLFGVLLTPVVMRSLPGLPGRVLAASGGILVLFSMLLIGRTGLLLAMVLMPAIWIIGGLTERPALRRKLRRIAMPTAVVAAALTTAAAVLLRGLPEHFVDYNLVRAAEVFLVFSDPQQSGTVRAVSQMYFFPEKLSTVLIGNGSLGRNAYEYLESDVGFVRVLFASGIAGSILLLMPIVTCIGLALRARHTEAMLAYITVGTLVASLVLHTKEVALLTRNQWSVQALLVCACISLAQRRAPSASLTRGAH